MKKIILFSLFYLLVNVAYSKKSDVFVSSAKLTNSEAFKVNLCRAYIDKAYLVINENMHLGFTYAKKSFNLASTIGNDSLLAESAHLMACFYYEFLLTDSILKYEQIALRIYKRLDKNHPALLSINLRITATYVYKNEFKLALQYINESEEVYKALNDEKKAKVYEVYIQLKIVKMTYYSELGLYEQGLKEFYEVRDFTKKNDTKAYCLVLAMAARLFQAMGDYSQAILLNKQALSYFGKNDNLYITQVYSDLGDYYLQMRKMDSAQFYYSKCISLNKQINLGKSTLNDVYMEISKNYFDVNKDTSLHYFNLIEDPVNLNDHYLFLKARLSNNNKEKISLIEKILKGYEYGDLDFELEIFKHLAEAYEKEGNIKLANIYMKRYEVVKDSLYSKQKSLNLQRLVVQDAIQQKNKEMALNEQNFQAAKQKHKRMIFGLIVSSFILVLILIIVYFLYRNQRQKRLITDAEKNLKNEENKNIRNEITILSMEYDRSMTLIENLKNDLKDVRNDSDNEAVGNLYAITNQFLLQDKKSKKLKDRFDGIENEFFEKLDGIAKLTKTEKKLAAFLKLAMSSKDIAPLLNVSEKTVEVYRGRLRKKLNMNTQVSFSDFFNQL